MREAQLPLRFLRQQARGGTHPKPETYRDDSILPHGWHTLRLAKLVEFKNGLNYPAGAVGPGLKIIGVADFRDHLTIGYDKLQEVSGFDGVDKSYLLQDGDLVFVRSNGSKALIGRAILIRGLTERVTHSGFTIRARVQDPSILPSYLALVVSSADFRSQLLRMGGGTNISNLSQDLLGRIQLVFPPLPQQARIVEILETMEQAVRRTEALIDAKLRHKRILAEQLLTGRLRFPEFGGQPWSMCHLGELFSERVECDRPDLPLLAVTGKDGVVARDLLAKRDTSSKDKKGYLRVAPGDIVYNTMRMWQGVFGLSHQEGIVSPDYTVCIPNGRVDARYVAYLFKLPAQISLFQRYSRGLVDDRLRIRFPDFARIRVTIPSVSEQRRIAEVLGLCDAEIALLRRQLEALKKQKEGLMQKLLTGEVRVKEFAP